MKPFEYRRADSVDHGAQLALADNAAVIAGGTNLLDLMKLQVETPEQIIDINRIGMNEMVDTSDGGLRIGAMVTNTEAAAAMRVRRDYPVLARAILAGATQQLRNKATTGGNLCQRTRCYYFTNIDQPCNKREPGSGCGAIQGVSRLHAVLGASDHCIATYPGDMAVAMSALNAAVEIVNVDGETRSVPIENFHCLPGDTPWRENVLELGDVITAVTLPPPVGGQQLYRKVRERSSYAFALVSIAAIIDISDGRFARADLAFGGLAHKPWHDARIGELLCGNEPSVDLFNNAADLLLENARGYGDNDFKIPLARRTIIAVLSQASGLSA